jgi:Tol biopolymer transport system component
MDRPQHPVTSRLTRRRFIGGALAATAGMVLATRWASHVAEAAGDPPGVIVGTRSAGLRDILLLSPAANDARVLLSVGVSDFVFDVALSPDGTRLVYGYYTTPTGAGGGGSDLMIVTVAPEVGQPTLLASRDAPGVLLGAPCWLPDGQSVLFEAIGVTARGMPAVRCERVNADGSDRQQVVDGARFPTLSADGQTLAYVKSLALGDTLWTRPLAGGPEKEIVSDADMAVISYPRFAPDGSLIAFAGINLAAEAPRVAPPDLLRVPLGHGLPTDPWIVAPDGSGLRRFAQLSGDDLGIAWSSDGRYLAAAGAYGVTIFSVADGSSRTVTDETTFGGIDWR